MASPYSAAAGSDGAFPSSRRTANAFQQHSRRGSNLPPYLMPDYNSQAAGPPPPPGGHYQPSINPSIRGGSSSGAGAGGRHARRGSVMDIAADMLAGEAGVEQLDKARKVSDKIEDKLEQLARPIRPWLPGIGRFLIVVTFLEDALRIMTQLGGAFHSDSENRSMTDDSLSTANEQTRTTISRSAKPPFCTRDLKERTLNLSPATHRSTADSPGASLISSCGPTSW